MNLFYTPDIDNAFYTLNEEESLHCLRVLRLTKGDDIWLANGKGMLYKSKIIDDNKKKCTVEVVEIFKDHGKRNYSLHIAIAPTKNIDRIEWFLEKATEIGIDEITPLICEHSERKTVNMERLNRVITAAMKQSLKAYHPLLNKEKRFDDFVSSELNASKFIAHCGDDTMGLKDFYQKGWNAVILIGPEGDFSEKEIARSKENGFTAINFGNNRYRTETAALVATHTIYLMNE
jgi:16S rRNA (uracil1498-N3)-methyltransferase